MLKGISELSFGFLFLIFQKRSSSVPSNVLFLLDPKASLSQIFTHARAFSHTTVTHRTMPVLDVFPSFIIYYARSQPIFRAVSSPLEYPFLKTVCKLELPMRQSWLEDSDFFSVLPLSCYLPLKTQLLPASAS